MTANEYHKVVEETERNLAPYAKKSLEADQVFLDGGDYHKYYADQWANSRTRSRIENRTPLQIERDRILYSSGMRKLTEKYHVLYSGDRRIIRNFTTHTMRMVQVARAISCGLKLNADFAEAIALGAKVGAPPFVHAAKKKVSSWIKNRIKDLDEKENRDSSRRIEQKEIELNLAPWLSSIKSEKISKSVRQFIPCAEGKDVEPYSSGSQGYWSLATDPLLVKSKPNRFSPETMFGIWRHSLDLDLSPNSFNHKFEIDGATSKFHTIQWNHLTYEALVVRYADDITWVIENLDDAHRAAVLAKDSNDLYYEIHRELSDKGEVPNNLSDAIFKKDSGGIYSYFITDLISESKKIFAKLGDQSAYRLALIKGDSSSRISLSNEAEVQLKAMKKFLEDNVFNEKRVSNRTTILETITASCLDLLYQSDTLREHVEIQKKVLGLTNDKHERALQLLEEPVHKIQLVADFFTQMSDQEIYDFVGIQGL